MSPGRRFRIVFLGTLVPQLALSAFLNVALMAHWSPGVDLFDLADVILRFYRPFVAVAASLAGMLGMRSGGFEGLAILGFVVLAAPVLGALAYSLALAALVALPGALRARRGSRTAS